MTAFENATRFFHACEGLQGWEGCADMVAAGASFTAQSEPIADVTTVQDYCEWMAGLGKGPLAGCHYDLHSSAWDNEHSTALFFATFHGSHNGDGGPVAPSGKSTATHYVYALTMDSNGLVMSMVKIWNAPWALRELGWAG